MPDIRGDGNISPGVAGYFESLTRIRENPQCPCFRRSEHDGAALPIHKSRWTLHRADVVHRRRRFVYRAGHGILVFDTCARHPGAECSVSRELLGETSSLLSNLLRTTSFLGSNISVTSLCGR